MTKTRGLEQPEDLEALKGVFGKYPEVQAVYLFGSVAEGRKGPESDLDLAIVPRSPAARARRLDILADLARAGFCNVDLIFLDTNDIVLRYEAVRLNRVVYQAEDFDPGEMYSRIVRQFLDFLPYLQVQREAYRRRILHDSGRGHPQAVEQTG
ncbi:MAG: nucleotidyltransferase domain-containing protein [Thermoflexales bacterium]|nr:nucleotidyltransferase domain-containing protein [Thermoflexales bacterium]